MATSDEQRAAMNTDHELWRKQVGDFYSPSIHVTESGGIGIDVGGYVFVKSVEAWHALAVAQAAQQAPQARAEIEELAADLKALHCKAGWETAVAARVYTFLRALAANPQQSTGESDDPGFTPTTWRDGVQYVWLSDHSRIVAALRARVAELEQNNAKVAFVAGENLARAHNAESQLQQMREYFQHNHESCCGCA